MPRKTLIIISLVLSAGLTASKVMALMGSGMMSASEKEVEQQATSAKVERIDEVISNILKAQGVSGIGQLDCTKVSQEEFERLGDSWMETIHPGEAHERMDAMMARLPTPDAGGYGGQGGEGSETLREVHINMGTRYLGCPGNREGRGWKPHMGMMPWAGMMGGEWTGGSGFQSSGLTLFWITWVVTIILVDILLVTLIRYFWKKGK